MGKNDLADQENYSEILAELCKNEEGFLTIANASPTFIWVGSPDGESIFINDAWVQFTGLSLKATKINGWAEALHPDDAQVIMPVWERSKTKGEPYEGEMRYRRKDGEYRWHKFRALPKFDSTGVLTAWYGISIDIHDSRELMEIMRANGEEVRKELSATVLLHELSGQIIGEHNIKAVYHYIILAALKIMEADSATIQIADKEDCLTLLASKGIHAKAVEFWKSIPINYNSVVGRAFLSKNRIIIEDIKADDKLKNSLSQPYWAMCNIQAMQATPLVSRNGNALGVLTTHWQQPHAPSALDLRMLDLLGRQVADILEQKLAEKALYESKALLAKELDDTILLQKLGARIIEKGDSESLFDEILDTALAIMNADAASMQMLSEDGKSLELLAHYGIHPQSAAFWQTISHNAGSSCGAAFATVSRVIVADVSTDESISAENREQLALCGIKSVQSTPLLARSGKLLGIISTHWYIQHAPTERELRIFDILVRQVADILERRQNEKELRETQMLLSSIFELSPIGLGFADTDGRFLLMNDEMRRFIPRAIIPSKDGEEYSRWQLFDAEGNLLSRNDSPGHKALRGETGAPFMDMLYTQDDGTQVWTSVASLPMRNESGEILGLICVVTDINELKRTGEELRNSEKQLKALLKQKDEFIGIASHELKTPVTSIKVYTEILQEKFEKSGNTDDARLMEKLNTQVDRLSNLIRDLLDTTKISEGKLMLFLEAFYMKDLIEERMEELQRISTKHKLVLKATDKDLIIADKERIGQVLTNLISNAIKYSPDGGKVIISTEHIRGGIKVCVKDSGIGIAEHLLNKVFDRFFRVTNPMMHTYPGMGLGLYITAGIVQRHGGTIGVDSKDGEGSDFYFTLPYNSIQST